MRTEKVGHVEKLINAMKERHPQHSSNTGNSSDNHQQASGCSVCTRASLVEQASHFGRNIQTHWAYGSTRTSSKSSKSSHSEPAFPWFLVFHHFHLLSTFFGCQQHLCQQSCQAVNFFSLSVACSIGVAATPTLHSSALAWSTSSIFVDCPTRISHPAAVQSP